MQTNLPRALRALRKRRRWSQAELARRAGLSRDVVHRVERDEIRGVTTGSLARLAESLDAQLMVSLRWRGAELDRLIDSRHAVIQVASTGRLATAGWITRPEVSFNHFGDRGRCDLVAWHPLTRTALIVEVKTEIGDLQQMLGSLDVKTRLGPMLVQQLGWDVPKRVVPALVLGDGGTNRRIVRGHEPLFRSFGLRGRTAFAWLRHPTDAGGLLWYEAVA